MFRSIIFTALVAVASAAQASDKPIYAPAPDWVKPAPPPAALAAGEEAPAFLVFDQQQLLQDGQVWAYMETATRIASPDVLTQAGTIQLQWQPGDGDLIVHRVTIVRGDERIDLLKQESRFTVLRREAELEALQMNGMLTATMAAEGLRVGDVLRVAYSVTRSDKVLKGGMQTVMPLVAEPTRVGFARARLLWKSGTSLNYRTYMPGLDVKPKQVGGYQEIDLPLPLAKPADWPDDAPIRTRVMPILEASSFADWAAVSKVMAPLYHTDGLIAPGSPLAAEVDRIAKADTDPRKRAAAALELVQGQVRYLFRGMDGGNYTPQTPVQTWSLRYGDCKAKTLLLLALLHGLGIEAEAVTANSQIGDAVPKRLPLPGAFDHVLVHATIGEKSLWLDGTAQGARLADLDDSLPFGWVLPLRDAGADLLAIPRVPASRPDVAVALDVDQTAGLGLPALYTARITLRGQMASQIATASAQLGAKERRDLLYGFARTMVGEGLPVSESLIQDARAGTTVVTATMITQSGWAYEQKRFSRTLDRTASQLNFQPDRTRPAWRDVPVATAPNGSLAYTTKIKLPKGITGFTLDGDTSLPETLAGVRLRRTAALADGIATVDERMDTVGAEISPADIPAVRARLALAQTRLLRVMAPDNYPSRREVVATARASGWLKPIEAAYARAIAVDPKDKLGYVNRASFLAGTYDWRGAIVDLDRVIALEPDLDSYLKRATFLSTLGDDSKALADAETAYGLDPSSYQAVAALTSLKGRTGKMTEALALLDERIAAGGKDKTGWLDLKSNVLSRAGRGPEAVAALDIAVAEKPGNPGLLNSRCWAKAIGKIALDTALKDCTKAIELGESPMAAFDSRALVYFQMGRMEDALGDIAAALDISPDLPASLYVRGVIRKRMGQAALGDADLAAARTMSPRIDEDYARYGVKP
ncbi:tetratricopeptide (TPR) repeat protein [Sphingomonas sp. UYAg733]